MNPSLLELARDLRRSLRKPVRGHEAYQALVRGKRGLEIGGPSELFRRVVPVYEAAKSIDGVNFSSRTMWEGQLVEGQTYAYVRARKGTQFICEATDLRRIPDQSYDFVLSSNNLEHVANPLKAVKEWMRVVRPGGHLLLVLPRRESNFDRNREVTRFEHLLKDLEEDVDEHDLTHLPEILEFHDYSMDPPLLRRLMSFVTLRGFGPAMNRETMEARGRSNFENRGLHHHVFDQELIKQVFLYFGLVPVLSASTKIDHIAVALKV